MIPIPNQPKAARFAIAGAVVLVLVAGSVALARAVSPQQEHHLWVFEHDGDEIPFHSVRDLEQGRIVFQDEDDERRIVLSLPRFRWHFGRLSGLGSAPGGWYVRSEMAGRVLANAEELELTEEQEERIRQAQRANRREEIQRQAAIEVADLELEELLEDEVADLDSIEQKLRELSNLQIEDQMAALRLNRNVREMLTAEQLEKLEDLGDHIVIRNRINQIIRDRDRRRR